jgi:hypothetical protein
LERNDLNLIAENYLNPAEFLIGERAQDPMEHCFLDFIKFQTKIRANLKETPFLDGHKLFMDGSSRVIHGNDRMNIQ